MIYNLTPNQRARSLYYLVPPGIIIAYAGKLSNVPNGYLLCNGTTVSKKSYPELYKAIGGTWGESAFSFGIPDLRGMFIRGSSADRSIGTKEEDKVKNHGHQVSSDYQFVTQYFQQIGLAGIHHGGDIVNRPNISSVDIVTQDTSGQFAEESRPKNLSINYIIKYKLYE